MKIAFFDVDGTLVADTSGVSFMIFASDKGRFLRESKELLQQARKEYIDGKVTYETFANRWKAAIGKGLKGKRQKEIYELTKEFWEIIKPKVASWAKDLIDFFNKKGFLTIAISGSNIELLMLYKEKLGLQQVYGTIAAVENGVYTGSVDENLVLGREKEIIVNNIIKTEDVDLKNSFGFGDNEHDRAFLDKVGNPIAISSESSLKHYAKNKGWPVYNFTDNIFEEVKKMLENEKIHAV